MKNKSSTLPPAQPHDTVLLAISSHSPNARLLLEESAALARKLDGPWFVVHVRQKPSLHFWAEATEHPLPEKELDYARKLGATVVVEHGDVATRLLAFARNMHIRYFVTSRPEHVPFTLRWKLPFAERLQRQLPGTTLVVI